MYSELIYTRCRQGIDILKEGRAITSDGYKVYSCTSSLLKDGVTDLQFLLNAAQAKQPYSEPLFMDDAYLYFVPEQGDSFMMDFYPVPFDPNANGDYAHRAGNFVNHIIIGDYSEFYPYELFRDNTVWNAKARGEAYYYENIPTDLPARDDISDPVGPFGIEEIGAFIADGRKEAFMSAVAFLISQYSLPPEERKFLVIRDESEQNIELWIAAIEHAFSPRMAASIPFATRMDKFATANRYTVNQMGVYQTQINLQDKNQKLRYRAMIVGVDERDRVNAGAARPLANSQFVLLDGKEKTTSFEADTSNRYYRFITSFNDSHQSFCREFLQMINITAPSADIYRLRDVYMFFESNSIPTAKDMGKVVAILEKYTLLQSSKLQNIYAKVTADLPRFLQEDLHSTLRIIKWLQSVSCIVGDTNASTRLTDIVCKAFAEQVFRKANPDEAFDFWQNIKNSEFASSVARYFVDPATIQANQSYLPHFTSAARLVYVLIYLDCAAFAGAVRKEHLKSVVNWGLELCRTHKDTDSAKKILKSLEKCHGINTQDILFAIAKDAERGYAEFIVMFLVAYDKSIVASDASMMAFLKKLSADRMEHLFGAVLKFRAKELSKPIEFEQMINLLSRIQGLSTIDQAEIFAVLDQKLSLTDRNCLSVAKAIQDKLPREAVCTKSAHILALDVLTNRRQRDKFTDIYNELIPQRFPSINNDNYIKMLVEALFKAKIDTSELHYVIQLFSREPTYIAELVAVILSVTSSRQTDEWNMLIFTALKTKDQNLITTIINECAKLKQGEKTLDQLSDMLTERETRDYFQKIAQKAREVIRSQKPQSGFGRFFGGRK